jgi:hypothetical protein
MFQSYSRMSSETCYSPWQKERTKEKKDGRQDVGRRDSELKHFGYSNELSPSVALIFKNFPKCYGTWRFNIVLTRALVVPILSQINPVYITLSSHPISPWSILILFFHILSCLPSRLFPSGFHIKILYVFQFFTMRFYTPCPSHPRWFDDSVYISGVNVM